MKTSDLIAELSSFENEVESETMLVYVMISGVLHPVKYSLMYSNTKASPEKANIIVLHTE